MSGLTRIIAPLLARAGLDVRAVSGADGQVRELVVTNPRQPTWGKVVLNRDGSMKWDYWGQVHDDRGAADIATVIIAIMAPRTGNDPERYAPATHPVPPEGTRTPPPQGTARKTTTDTTRNRN